MYVCGYVRLGANAQGDLGTGFPGTGVTDGCDHSDMGGRIQTASPRGVYSLNREPPLSSPGIPLRNDSVAGGLHSDSWEQHYLMMKGFHLNQTCPNTPTTQYKGGRSVSPVWYQEGHKRFRAL